MFRIGQNIQVGNNTENSKSIVNQRDIDLNEISVFYTTEQKEDERTTFENTFTEENRTNNKQGAKFLKGLTENKTNLMKELDLSDEEYDSLACTALALASQETGMGKEEGYESENKGIGKFFRGIAKKFHSWFGGGSASSGLTQMKIYDFMNSDSFGEDKKQILKSHGIEAKGVATNNLYDNPDKSAVATMVVLKSITENYENYQNVLSTEHSNIEEKLDLSTDTKKELALKKGNDILSKITDKYAEASDEKKAEIRQTLKQCFLSSNGSKKGDKDVDDEYNEEIQLDNLNKILKEVGISTNFNSASLTYLRYALTEDGKEMNKTEYCAYAWNKGTGTTGMQLDRLLADKIGTILSDPDDFDYDQFTANVANLAERYASQAS